MGTIDTRMSLVVIGVILKALFVFLSEVNEDKRTNVSEE